MTTEVGEAEIMTGETVMKETITVDHAPDLHVSTTCADGLAFSLFCNFPFIFLYGITKS